MRQTTTAATILLLATLLTSPAAATTETTGPDPGGIKFAGVPIPSYNPSFGWGIGALVSANYRIARSDTLSPPSTTMLFGFYAQNESWAYGIFQQIYLADNTWRGDFALGKAGINFQFYLDDPGSNGDGSFQDYATDNLFIRLRWYRAVVPNVFLGLMYQYRDAYLTLPGVPTDPSRRTIFRTLGLATNYDTRDNTFNARNGWFVDASFQPFSEFMGNDPVFQIVDATTSKYHELSERSVLAANLWIQAGFGAVPFEEQAVVGQRNLRGYSTGKYRNDQVYTAQIEYRHSIHGRWGSVAFAGVGWATPELSVLQISETLGSIGFGVRYRMITEYDINVGMDIAWGNEERVFYFRIGEAF